LASTGCLPHITGNLVVLAAQVAGGVEGQIAKILSVPVFFAMVSLTVLLARGLELIGSSSLCPLLLLHFLLLAGFLGLCVAAGPHLNPNATIAILASMAGVSAMAVQNVLVQISLKGVPATAVMTSNVTRFARDVVEVLVGADPAEVNKARKRAARTLPVVIGFAIGCGLGAACEVAFGMWSLALPTGVALIGLVLGCDAEPVCLADPESHGRNHAGAVFSTESSLRDSAAE
jgi:uncharacterized membrane protein YoaK (UPF0700 family)